MKFREVTSKLVFPSALVAIGSYIFIVFMTSWYWYVEMQDSVFLTIRHDPPDALLDLVLPVAIVCVLSSAGAAYTLGINMKCPGIRVAAAVLGVVGGVMNALVMPIPWLVVKHTLVSLMAIGGGIFALRRPGVGGILMLLATTIATIPVWWIIGITLTLELTITLPLVFLGGLLALASALASDKKRPAAIYVAMTLGIIGGLSAGMIAHGVSTGLIWIQGMIQGIEELPFPFWTWVLLFPGMGVLGGILVLEKPKVAGILMLISAISGPVGLYAVGRVAEVGFDDVGFVLAFVFAGIACLLLIIAATIAFNKK